MPEFFTPTTLGGRIATQVTMACDVARCWVNPAGIINEQLAPDVFERRAAAQPEGSAARAFHRSAALGARAQIGLGFVFGTGRHRGSSGETLCNDLRNALDTSPSAAALQGKYVNELYANTMDHVEDCGIAGLLPIFTTAVAAMPCGAIGALIGAIIGEGEGCLAQAAGDIESIDDIRFREEVAVGSACGVYAGLSAAVGPSGATYMGVQAARLLFVAAPTALIVGAFGLGGLGLHAAQQALHRAPPPAPTLEENAPLLD